eukprot:TRINITY_DN1156_c0_g1_i2.p1 TRINITY_DN1156_c0_g1~~TRINITY_DN1156_c0_g1_i2.p1  ORF type:complete len:362 (+),score=94.92 TRINITY_DN1156_c0_g1_i2:825-1910(+)
MCTLTGRLTIDALSWPRGLGTLCRSFGRPQAVRCLAPCPSHTTTGNMTDKKMDEIENLMEDLNVEDKDDDSKDKDESGKDTKEEPVGEEAEEEEEEEGLQWTADTIAQYILEKDLRNIIVMSGAGVSTSAGLPDFRSKGTGLYEQLQDLDVPYPEAVFDLDYLQTKPEAFYAVAKALWPGEFKPTPAHYFIKKLNDDGRLLRCYTQNIDGLEDLTGLPRDKCFHAHGNFRSAFCTKCYQNYKPEAIKPQVMAGEVPRCDCEGIIKPTIVFFGENLPEAFFPSVKRDFPKCDLLIVMGTSLVVHPFASLVTAVPPGVPRLLINNDRVGEGLGLFKDAKRDVHLDGKIDDRCIELAKGLGYEL